MSIPNIFNRRGQHSGFVSALVAAKHPGLVDRLVLLFPALCIPDDARAGKMMFAQFDPQNIPEYIHCGPMKLGRCYPADVIDMDPILRAAPTDSARSMMPLPWHT